MSYRILIHMKKSWIIIGSVAGIIIAAVVYLLLTSGKVESPSSDTSTNQASDLPAQTTNPQPSSPTPQATATPGVYTSYNAEVVAKTSGRRILFFHAPWCPQCRALEQSIQAGTVPNNVTIFKTDYDSHTALRQKYGVTLQTTLVELGANGEVVNKYVAYDTPTLEAVIKGLKL